GAARLGGDDLPHDRTRRAVHARRDQADGGLSRHRFRPGRQAGRGREVTPRNFRGTSMRELVARYLNHSLSRRGFVPGLTQAGLTATAAQSVLSSVSSVASAQSAAPGAAMPAPVATTSAPATAASAATAAVKPFQGPGGAAFAEQLIASGVKYVFGNSA